MSLNLDEHDEAIVASISAFTKSALLSAHSRIAVARRISVLAVAEKNRGRNAAKKRHPFEGICEASGKPLEAEYAELNNGTRVGLCGQSSLGVLTGEQ